MVVVPLGTNNFAVELYVWEKIIFLRQLLPICKNFGLIAMRGLPITLLIGQGIQVHHDVRRAPLGDTLDACDFVFSKIQYRIGICLNKVIWAGCSYSGRGPIAHPPCPPNSCFCFIYLAPVSSALNEFAINFLHIPRNSYNRICALTQLQTPTLRS